MRKIPLVILTILMIILGSFLYDSRHGKPLLPKQIDAKCPYYKDFLGRVYFKYTTGSLFIIARPYDAWLKVRDISHNNFRIVKFIGTAANVRCIATDGQSVIYEGRVYKNADAATFEILWDDEFFKDKTSVYNVSSRINGADPGSFVVLSPPSGCSGAGPSYAKDKDFVYYAGGIVQGADLASFELYCDNYQTKARDKNGTYSSGKLDTTQ